MLLYSENMSSHMVVISSFLAAANKDPSDSAYKAFVTEQLFDYITKNAIPFISQSNNLKTSVIKSCYSIKNEFPLMEDLIISCNRLLTALGEPLDAPIITTH